LARYVKDSYKSMYPVEEKADLAFRRLLAARPASNEAIATILAPALARYVKDSYKSMYPMEEKADLAFRRLLAARPASNEAIATILAPAFASYIRGSQNGPYSNNSLAVELAGKLGQCGPVVRNVEETLLFAAQNTSNAEVRNAIYAAIRDIRRASITGPLISTDYYPEIVVRSEGQDWRLRITEESDVGRDSLQIGALVLVQFDMTDKRVIRIEKPRFNR
jgi:hypothetical protein